MRQSKRFLALMLSMMMTFSLLIGAIGTVSAEPVSEIVENTTTGVRYDDVAAALDAAADGQTVKLLENVTLANAIVFDRSGFGVTLDLNGYSIVRTVHGGGETGDSGAAYVKDGLLIIRDSSASAEGFIEYLNTGGLGGSGLNIDANGSVKLLSGGILGTGQSVFAHDAGARFEMTGGVVYGSGDHVGSEAIAAVSGAYITISGGYVGTKNAGAAMIWSGATLDSSFWQITGGYFTSKDYHDGSPKEISNFVTQGEVTELVAARTHPISGATEYKYHLTIPRTITFDANGGNSSATSLVTDSFGKLSALPADAVKAGAAFKGWYTAATGGTQITTSYIFDKDTTVYAQYDGPAIDYAGEQLTGFVPGLTYTVSDTTSVTEATYATADAYGNIPISEVWFGGTWSLEETGGGSPAANLFIPLRAVAPPGVSAVGVSQANAADGKILGVSTAMEYRLKGTDTWISAGGNVATGLAEGTYEVRTKATSSAFASVVAEVTVGVLVSPMLTAVGDNANNLVKLNWTSSLAGQEYYRVYQKENGGDGLDEFQSIPLKDDIKVLNVYPDIGGSDGLQSWMQTYGNPGSYKMEVDKVSISDFNGADTTKNYAYYLSKDGRGAYKYDVLYFGAWDVNNGRDLSAEAHEAVEAFILYGGGVLVGHDTASFAHTYFIDLAQKYLNMDVKFQEHQPNPSFPPLGSTRVAIQRRGFPMNYPYALGDVGTILITPMSHSYFQFAKGDVWFKYANIEWGSGPEINEYNGQSGTNNFYLTTWNNTALIQTGHSNGSATVDEQKILANTLFYLAQTSTANSFDDRMSQDVAAPNAVSGAIAVAAGSATNKKIINWNEATDNGSSYSYYLKAISFIDGSSRTSAETTATVTTGVKGYAVSVNTNAANENPGNTVTTNTNTHEVDNLEAGVTYYAHIKVFDNAGNFSEVYTISFTIDAAGLTVTATDPLGTVNNGKTKLAIAETVGANNRLVYWNAGSGNVSAPGIGDQLNGYQDLPDNGLIEAVHGDNIGVAEVNANGEVVRFGQTVAVVIPSPPQLIVSSVLPDGTGNAGKTQLVAGAASGNKLVYVNFGSGDVTEPSLGATPDGYTDLPTDGLVGAVKGDKMGIAEIGPDGKIVRFGVAIAKVAAESEAAGLHAVAVDPAGAGTDGKTKVAVSAAAGNTIKVINFKKQPATIPATGSQISDLGYEELAGSGMVEADNGDLLGLAEVDEAGRVIRYTTVSAVVRSASEEGSLAAGSQAAGGGAGEGKTQITGNIGEGHKWKYMNFGPGPVTTPALGQPAGNGYVDMPDNGAVDANNGDILGIAEVDEHGNVVKFGTTRAVVKPVAAAGGLAVAATDVTGTGTDGLTKLISKAAEGNRLMYVNFGESAVSVPAVGEALAGYAELPATGLVKAMAGDKIGVVEVDANGKVVRYGVAEAVVIPEAAANKLTATSVDPTGEGTDGKTRIGTATGTTIGAGNKLVYFNAGQSAIQVPRSGDVLSGYEELPAGGLVTARNGDHIALAEVDASGKVVRFGTVKALVESEAAAQGLSGSAADLAGAENDDKTKLAFAAEVEPGNKRVYLNFGKNAVSKPNVGDTLKGYSDIPAGGAIEAVHGDIIGVAEVDAAGKVVKFGLIEAEVKAESAASGLQVVSVDPPGFTNNGKSVIQAQAEAGHRLVYVNFGTGTVLVPNVNDRLSGYTELPANGMIPAIDGDRIAVAEINAEGRVVRFGLVHANVVDSRRDTGTGVGDSGPATVPSKEPKGVAVLVNGKVEYAGIATLSSENGRTLTTIDVDQAKLQAKLDAEGQGAVVTIPWREDSDRIVARLTGQMIENMDKRDATLVLDTPTGAYKIPTGQIRVNDKASRFGPNVSLEDIQIQIHIALATSEELTAAKERAAKHGVTLMATPVTFRVTAEHGGKSIEITDYNVYVERTVALPEGIDPNKITTGVVLEPNGTLRHVPTQVTKVNDRYYALIHSLTNSDYGVIWNPMTFADVAGHWSEAIVNEMGSRLVVSGVGGGNYNPDLAITRAEFAAIMVRGLGLRLEQGNVPFTDVSGTEWYGSAVNTAAKFGLINGYEDNTFRPQNKITRQEAMTIVARAMPTTGLREQLEGKDLSQVLRGFKDAKLVAGWAKEGVSLSVAAEVIRGRTADALAGNSFITRAEVAAIVQRLLKKSDLI